MKWALLTAMSMLLAMPAMACERKAFAAASPLVKRLTAASPKKKQLSKEDAALLAEYQADEKEYQKMETKSHAICTDDAEQVTDCLPACSAQATDYLATAPYVIEGKRYLVSEDEVAATRQQQLKLEMKWVNRQ